MRMRIPRQDIVDDDLERPGLEQTQGNATKGEEQPDKGLPQKRAIVIKCAAVDRHQKNLRLRIGHFRLNYGRAGELLRLIPKSKLQNPKSDTPMHHLIEVWFHWVQTGGYAAVFWLMALESTIFPIPSEVVIPPAAIVAATQQGTGMSLVGVVIAGALGSWFGSALMYLVASWAGRAAMLRWGKYFLVPPEKLARAEVFTRRYHAGGIFFARLLPVIRHLISIPAGIVRMGF